MERTEQIKTAFASVGVNDILISGPMDGGFVITDMDISHRNEKDQQASVFVIDGDDPAHAANTLYHLLKNAGVELAQDN